MERPSEKMDSKSKLLCATLIMAMAAIAVVLNELPPIGKLGIKSFEDLSYVEKETVRFWHLLSLILMLVPGTLWLIRKLFTQRAHFVKNTLGFYIALSSSNAFVNALKFALGKERPDYKDRLKRFPHIPHRVADGRRSFPSGHSASAICAALYIASVSVSVLVSCRLTSRSKAVLFAAGAVLPMVLAILVGVTRILDHRHDIIDVTGGFLIGIGVTHLVERMMATKKTQSLQ